MMGFTDRSCDRPFPELLAAYADGELDAAGRARVEAWLAEHPEAKADLDAQRALSRKNARFWQASAPPAPGEKSWSRLLARVHYAIYHRPASPAVRPARVVTFRRAAALAGLAAAVWVALGLFRPGDRVVVRPTPADDEPAWVVAAATDVDIESIQEADTDLLLVGRP